MDDNMRNCDQIETWYNNAIPRRQDVLGDYAGRELCAIHGESLLVYCIGEAKVDFQDGFQLLHAVHAVELFLSKLQKRECHFQVLWFADHEGLLLDSQLARADPDVACTTDTNFCKIRLARAVLIEHLQRHPQVASSFSFDSMDSGKFLQHLAENPLRLFFVSDRSKVLSAPNDGQNQGGLMTFQSIIYRLNTQGYTVALMDDIEFQSSEVRCTLFSATRGLPFKKEDWLPVPLPPSNYDEIADHTYDVHALLHGIKRCSVRELVSILVLADILKIDSSSSMKQRVVAFLAHLAILKHCSLSNRPVHPGVARSNEELSFLKVYCELSRKVLGERPWEVAVGSTSTSVVWDAYDLVDGRLWLAVLEGQSSVTSETKMASDFRDLTTRLSALCGFDLQDCLPGYLSTSSSPTTESLTVPFTIITGSILPFQHPDFDDFLGDVAVPVDWDAEQTLASSHNSTQVSQETHWHNTKKLAETTINKPDPRKMFYFNRRNQRFMTQIRDYAASLTNATGKILDRETIVTAVPPKKLQTVVQKSLKGKSRERKAVTSNKNVAQEYQKAKQVPEIVQRWRSAYENLQKEKDTLKQYEAAVKYFQNLSPLSRDVVGADVVLHVCNILGKCLCDSSSKLKMIAPNIAALIWAQIQELSRLPLSAEAVQIAQDLCKAVMIPVGPLSVRTDGLITPLESRSATVRVISTLERAKDDARLVTRPAAFQLGVCGPYLERGFDSQPDARVLNFEPDGWQRKVLDAIDERQSLFVVAPTSAGKTFISFYAMKQVLKQSNDGVLVYVAPTKALVNQVAAEIEARFSKTFPQSSSSGKSVWAIKTRDQCINNPTGCQVLVTVPHMLQILLMSPSSMEGSNPWPLRLRWIIFDEIHSIGQSDEGVVWEQLVLMAPCPIIALSATVGNPYAFRDWLTSCEKSKGRQIRMITHSSRYSDLRNYVWMPSRHFQFSGVTAEDSRRWPIPGLEADGYNEKTPFMVVHPVASLIDRSRDSLDDISLEPRDSVLLWRSLKRHHTADFPLDPSLNPDVFFSSKLSVTKKHAVAWEVQLKKVLLSWMHDHRSPFPAVHKDLSPIGLRRDSGGYHISSKLLELLTDLRRHGAVPALLFLYDRKLCEYSVWHIVEGLVSAEKAWKKNSTEWKQTMASFEKHQKAKTAKKAPKISRSTKGKKNDDDGNISKFESMREAANQEVSKWDLFDPNAPLAEFSLANHTRLPASELEKIIKSLDGAGIRPFFINGLRRGVGVHHAGMNRRYRQIVEMLFRKGFLTAVVATGTLALGINMPCKTVVFVGDSTYLNALNYRQASGRAGRRGFDTLGNVVFYGFTPQRVMEVLSSRLPDLRGHFPLSTSLILRTCMLLHQTDRCSFARECIVRSLFSQTRMYMGGPAGQDAIKHHLRFSIEYLRRNHMLSVRGVPLNFAGLVGHLYYTENSAFAFHALLQEGYFHRLCAGFSGRASNTDEVMRTMVLVLSHLFCRRLCRRYQDQTWLATVVKPSSSIVLLPPLPSDASAILRANNAKTRTIFQTYVQSYVRQHLADQPDRSLPLTGILVGPQGDHSSSGGVQLRSPFAALSGFTDDFQSVHDLCETVRAGVFLQEASVPYLPVSPDDTDGVPLNAYIYDFFRHGDLSALKKGNGIREGDVWFLLQEFSMILATIITSLTLFLDPDAVALDDLGVDEDMWDEKDEQDEQDLDYEDENVQQMSAADTGTAVARLHKEKRKKEKVADSWEDETDSDSSTSTTTTKSATIISTSRSKDNESQMRLRNVLSAFEQLKTQFDVKFRKVWA